MKREYLGRMLEKMDKIKGIRWTDADEGQLDFAEQRPPVAFPCCLVDVAVPQAENASANNPMFQRVRIRVTLTVAFDDCASFNSKAPRQVRETAFRRLDLLQTIHESLQGQWEEGCLQPYTRRSVTPEKRPDGLKVYVMVYDTVALESGSGKTPRGEHPL